MLEGFDTKVTSREPLLELKLGELWDRRDMLVFLVLRDFKIRFKQSALGVAWALLQPLATTLVFTYFIGGAMNIQFDGPYPLYFLSGLMIWNAFAKTFGNGTLSLVNEAELIRKVYFPRMILPIYQAFSVLTDLVIAMVIFAGLCLWYGHAPGIEIFWAIPFLFLTMLAGIAISLWLGPVNVRFRDIQIVLPLITQLLFVASAVMFPIRNLGSLEHGVGFWLAVFNPMIGIVEGFRLALLGEGNPFQTANMISYGLVVLLFLGGVAFFNTSQRRFADVI
jgi:lipopolysaccharide transport system permease protein